MTDDEEFRKQIDEILSKYDKDNLVESFGNMASGVAVMYLTFRENGLSMGEAVMLTGQYLNAMFKNTRGEHNEG